MTPSSTLVTTRISVSLGRGNDEEKASNSRYVAVGTQLPEKDALQMYVKELESQGWVLEQDHLDRTKILVRGKHERIGAEIGGPGWLIEQDENFQEAKDVYATLFYVVVDFILPSRDQC